MAKNIKTNSNDVLDENKTIKKFVVTSAILHVVVLFVNLSEIFPSRMQIIDEIAIEADMLPDFNMAGSTQDALPETVKAEEIAVQKQILPQLPKSFKLEEEEKTENKEEVAEEEKKPDEEKAEEKVEEQEKAAEIEKDQRELLEVKKREALERLLKEKARKEEKFADNTSAPLSKKLAQLRDEMANKDDGASGGGSGLTGAAKNKYIKQLYKAIKRNYSLPAAYNLQNAEIVAKIGVVLNTEGEISKIEIYESSGDEGYDYLALKAVKDSVPLPKPPVEEAGKMIIISFNPKTF